MRTRFKFSRSFAPSAITEGRFVRPRKLRRTGLTLVEVMLALAVTGSACLAAVAGLLMSLRMANSNLLALQAASAARSVAERLESLDYESLFGSTVPVDVPGSATGSLAVDEWNNRRADFRRTPENSGDDLKYRIRPTVTRVTQANGLDFAQVVIEFEWSDPSFSRTRTLTDNLTLLVAPVSSF